MPVRRPPRVWPVSPPLGAPVDWSDSLAYGLKLAWLCNEGAGSRLIDTVHGSGGTINGATWTTGLHGPALSFNGTSNFAANTTFPWPAGTPASVSLWCNAVAGHTSSGFTIGDLGDPNRFHAHLPYSDNNIYWDYGNSTTSGRLSTDFSPYTGKNTHVVLVSGSNFMAIYINGRRRAVSASFGAPAIGLTGAWLGKYDSGPGYFYQGKLWGFRVYNRILQPSEAMALYSEPWRPFVRQRRRGLVAVTIPSTQGPRVMVLA